MPAISFSSSLPSSSAFFAAPRSVRRVCVLAACALLAVAGCKSTPARPDDATLTSTLNRQLSADSTINGQPLQGTVQNGVATLSGSVANEAQKTIAARDASGIEGVTSVVNNLTVASATAVAALPAPIPVPTVTKPATQVLPTPRPSRPAIEPTRNPHAPAPIERQPDATSGRAPAAPAPITPAAPPQPVFRNVTVPSGSTLPVRVTQTLDSATTQLGDTFSGVTASDVVIDGLVAIPAGSNVTGKVDAVQEAAHFKGASLLTVSINSVRAHGERLTVSSDPYSVTGKSRGKNTAEKAGIGAVGGAILGGIFGGGKGAAIGAAAGGAGGAGINAVTRGQQVQIPSETVVRFHLASPVSLRVRADASGTRNPSNPNQANPDAPADGGLQRRPNPPNN